MSAINLNEIVKTILTEDTDIITDGVMPVIEAKVDEKLETYDTKESVNSKIEEVNSSIESIHTYVDTSTEELQNETQSSFFNLIGYPNGTSEYVYLNTELGNDETGDGTEENPFKTLSRAGKECITKKSGSLKVRITDNTDNKDIDWPWTNVTLNECQIESKKNIRIIKDGSMNFHGTHLIIKNSVDYPGTVSWCPTGLVLNNCYFESDEESLFNTDLIINGGSAKIENAKFSFLNLNNTFATFMHCSFPEINGLSETKIPIISKCSTIYFDDFVNERGNEGGALFANFIASVVTIKTQFNSLNKHYLLDNDQKISFKITGGSFIAAATDTYDWCEGLTSFAGATVFEKIEISDIPAEEDNPDIPDTPPEETEETE